MQDANGKEKCASHKESPKGMTETVKDVCKPSKETHKANKLRHLISSCK
jgi:hypothetical protein